MGLITCRKYQFIHLKRKLTSNCTQHNCKTERVIQVGRSKGNAKYFKEKYFRDVFTKNWKIINKRNYKSIVGDYNYEYIGKNLEKREEKFMPCIFYYLEIKRHF